MCRQALPVIYEREDISTSFEIGEYWDKSVQIDIVGSRNDHWTDIGECKWGTVKSYKGIAEDLGKKIQAYPNTGGPPLVGTFS